ncbi:MAG: prephenate dehydrogenase [Clostridiaceae bacterium]|nr:prephenate dehydrogenase [Clostridiaceae bacterium]
MIIGIIGLGLIGGSFAKAIKYNTDSTVLGYDKDAGVLLRSKLLGAVDDDLTQDRIGDCDIVITAIYPEATKQYITENADKFKKGALVLDTCGVKGYVCEDMWKLAKENGFKFIGAHPMAGRHLSGFDYSLVNLFENASMILIPDGEADINDLETLKKLFCDIGFTNIQFSTPEEHDRIIAFTSQLAHVVSNAYVKSPNAKVHAGFSAGSYKDLTRVAKLNEEMWTELFLENADNLTEEIDYIIENLKQYSDAIKARDADTLRQLLREGRECKERIDGDYRD